MSESAITRLLKSAAREGATLQKDRYRILTRLISHDGTLGQIPQNLWSRLLTLRDGWKVLDLRERDWDVISQLDSVSKEKTVSLVCIAKQYIIQNKRNVNALIDATSIYSNYILGLEDSRLVGILDRISEIDKQSVIIYRFYGLRHQDNHEKYMDYLRGRHSSRWLRTRLASPLLYHTLNTPSNSYLDTFMSYMMPQDSTGGVERGFVRHILRDDLSIDRSIAYRAGTALYCHPYDALESFTNYFEIKIASRKPLDEIEKDLLRDLSFEFPSSRINRLNNYLSALGDPGIFSGPSETITSLPMSIQNTLNLFVDPKSVAPLIDDLPTEAWRALARMRWSRYPEAADFEAVTLFSRTYIFLEAGRLMEALATSMYMLPRDNELMELRHLMRLHEAVGQTTAYIWGAPRGDALMDIQKDGDPRFWLGADLRAGAALTKRLDAEDRTWFHAVHWELRRPQKNMHVTNWLAVIRRHFTVRPRYLTGVDWSWVDRMIPLVRIAPFMKTSDGPFALLLRDIEEQQKDSTLLRTAIEGLASSARSDEFVSRLISEYGKDAIAFVQYFLTAEMIMLLELAPNMTAALSERITALETCVTRFGFSELMSEDELKGEQETLTSSLMLLRVNSSQFDVPWANIKRAAVTKQRDNYQAHKALVGGDRTLSFVTDSAFLYSHAYPNGHKVDYLLRSNSATLYLFVLGVIDSYYEHPTYGIEAILSTRFRHDTMRREFVEIFEKVKKYHIPGVMPQEQDYIVGRLSMVCLEEVDAWLQVKMHTRRIDHEAAPFDFAPTDHDLSELHDAVDNAGDLDSAIDVIIDWIIRRLDQGLFDARKSFVDDLWPMIEPEFLRQCEAIQNEYRTDPTVMRAVSTAVSDAFHRQAALLSEWFIRTDPDEQSALSFGQIKRAVDGRFEREVQAGQVSIRLPDTDLAETPVISEHVKLLFDLQSEIVRNALKHSGLNETYVRITRFRTDHQEGFIFSSTACQAVGCAWFVQGDPFTSLHDALFREGNSGLVKIAALAASVFGDTVSLKAVRKARSFHLVVPLWKSRKGA